MNLLHDCWRLFRFDFDHVFKLVCSWTGCNCFIVILSRWVPNCYVCFTGLEILWSYICSRAWDLWFDAYCLRSKGKFYWLSWISGIVDIIFARTWYCRFLFYLKSVLFKLLLFWEWKLIPLLNNQFLFHFCVTRSDVFHPAFLLPRFAFRLWKTLISKRFYTQFDVVFITS